MFENNRQMQKDIKYVIYNPPATIIKWTDGIKTIVKTSENDKYDPVFGFLMAYFQNYSGMTKTQISKFTNSIIEEYQTQQDKKNKKKMKIINTQRKLCPSCMEEHDVEVVETDESNVFKGEQVEFTAVYEYCSNAEEYSENEEMIKINDLAFKDAYRRKQSLLTSKEIQAIREKYDISQKEFSEVLGWGMATITRYEK